MIVSTMLLTVFFYLVVTPIGLATRCFGKVFLGLNLDAKANSYWLVRDHSKPRRAADSRKIPVVI